MVYFYYFEQILAGLKGPQIRGSVQNLCLELLELIESRT